MSEFVVYILHSQISSKIYIGYTSNLIQRFYSHNFKATKGYTRHYRPWTVIHVAFFLSNLNCILPQIKRSIQSSISSINFFKALEFPILIFRI